MVQEVKQQQQHASSKKSYIYLIFTFTNMRKYIYYSSSISEETQRSFDFTIEMKI